MNKVEEKLSAARTRLILDKPFLGALVLRLPLKKASGSWCTSSATDARCIYYSADYMDSLSLSQVQFVLAHEALHCGLSHFARRNNRDLNRWNIACDHAVNLLLTEDGLELAPGALLDDTYKGLAAEEIYPLIEQDSDEETLDQHLYDNPQYEPSNPQADDDFPDQQQDRQQDQQQDRQPDQTPHQKEKKEQQENQNQQSSAAFSEKPSNAGKHRSTRQPQQTSANESNVFTQSTPHSAVNGHEIESNRIADQQQQTETSDRVEAGDSPRTPDISLSCQSSDTESASPQQPPPLNAQEREQLNVQWQQRLAGAAQQASQAGKMKGSVARLVERLLRSTVPWRTVLARFMSGSCRQDYNITRPSQRREGDAILPSLHSRQTKILIALDTSGSIEDEELTEFVAEINAIKSLVNAKITLLACDAELDSNGPWVFEPWEQLVLPETLKGGGGTDFTPVFDWIAANYLQLDLVVYFTDARGRFPQIQPATETLWLVKGGASVPWGQRIQLN